MSGVFESIDRAPVEYLPTGDRGLLMAWVAHSEPSGSYVSAVLCLEDGRTKEALLEEFKFDYRFDNNRQSWIDVSKIQLDDSEDTPDADPDQEDADHGGEEVSGRVPDAEGTGPGDPLDG